MTIFLTQSVNMTTRLLSLKDEMIRGLRQALKTKPGQKMFTSKHLSITVVSINRTGDHPLKLDADGTSFVIQDLSKAFKKGKIDNDIVFLEVSSYLQTACIGYQSG